MCQDEIGYYSVGRWMGGVMLLFYVLICMIRSYFPKVKRYVVMTWTIHCLIFTWISTFKQWILLLICGRHQHQHHVRTWYHTHTDTHTPKERSSEWQTRLVSLLETHKMYHPWAQRIHHIALAQHRTLAHAHIYIHLYLYMQKIEYFLYFTPKNSRKNVHFSVLLLARWLARSLYVQANKCYFHLYRLLSTDLDTSPFVWFCHFFGS